MSFVFRLGCRVRHQHDDGWGQPGCVIALAGDKLRVFWPEENMATDEAPANLVPYCLGITQPPEIAA